MPHVTETMHIVLGTLASFEVLTVDLNAFVIRMKIVLADRIK